MKNIFELDKTYSTTRRVTKQKPVIENNPEDKVKTQLFLPAKPDRKAEGGLRCQGYFKRNEKDKPLISVITVVFNGEKYLEQTIQSVINQTYDNVEYIIIDGGSTDGTLDVIRKYEGMVDYWVSEGDEGISDAFNKGIELCSGEWHIILNADDWFDKEAIEILVSFIKHKINVISGCSKVIDASGNIYKYYHSNPIFLTKKMSLAHNTCLIRTSALNKIGRYNLNKKIAMDHELMLKIMLRYGLSSFAVTEKCISYYRLGGISDKHVLDGFREVRDNLMELINYRVEAYWVYFILVSKHLLLKSLNQFFKIK